MYEKQPPQKGTNPGATEKDYISYTVSAPSGRGTAMLSVDGKNWFYWHLISYTVSTPSRRGTDMPFVNGKYGFLLKSAFSLLAQGEVFFIDMSNTSSPSIVEECWYVLWSG